MASVPALSRMVDNRDGDVRNAASNALSRISPAGKGLGPALMAAIYNRDGSSVECLTAALKHSDDATALMPRLKAVANDDPDLVVRDAARHAEAIFTGGDSVGSTTRPAG